MRSPFTHSLTLFLLFLLFLVSCRKEIVDVPHVITPITLTEAQQYYEQSLMSQHSSARTHGTTGRRKELLKRVRWNKAVTKKMGDTDVLVVPLRHDKYLVPRFYEKDQPVPNKLAQADKGFGLDELSRLYFYKNEKGKIQAELVTAIPNQEWAAKPYKPFSGYVLVEDERMEFKKGFLYKEGKIIGSAEANESTKNGRNSAVNLYCYTYPVPLWQEVYVIKADGSRTESFWSVYDYAQATYCSEDTRAPVISGGGQVNYDVTQGWYSGPTSPNPTEEEIFRESYRALPSSVAMRDVREYLKCFTINQNDKYTLYINVDQPINGSPEAWSVRNGNYWVGHVFITLTQEQSNGFVIQRSLGFWPEQMVIPGISSVVPGTFQNDSNHENGWDVQLGFAINSEEMGKIIAFIPQYTNYAYDLWNRNCANFAADVLGQIGIGINSNWMNTYLTSTYRDFGNYPVDIRGPSVGAFGEQLYYNSPSRTTSKSHAGGDAPTNKGNCN